MTPSPNPLLAGYRLARARGLAPTPEELAARNAYRKLRREAQGDRGRRARRDYMRRWRRAHPEAVALDREQARPRTRAHNLARRKARLGRICSACGRTDSDRLWGSGPDLCGGCERARLRNGACGECGQSFRLVRRADDPRGGRRFRRVCGCEDETARAGLRALGVDPDHLALALDALTVAGGLDVDEITGRASLGPRELARVLGRSRRSVDRGLSGPVGRLLEAVRALAPGCGAVLVRGPRLEFDARALGRACREIQS